MYEFVAFLRDVVIIIAALLTIALLVVLILLVLRIRSLIEAVPNRVRPMIDSAEQSMTTVRGTSDFVSTMVVRPVIRALAIASAIERFFQVLFGTRRS